MNGIYQDIPRLYTAIAECWACFVALGLYKKRFNKKITTFVSVFFILFQSSFLHFTAAAPKSFWILFMILAASFMFFYIWTLLATGPVFAGYITIVAFLQAEFAASFEWQIHCYLLSRNLLPFAFEYILFFSTYGIIYVSFFKLFRSSVKDLESTIGKKELISSLIIAVLAFTLSNMSFISTTLPFTSGYRQEIFIIRTLMDLLGIIFIYSYQNRIAELKLKNELSSMQIILENQYQNFLNYKDSVDVINIKYHDLKHQIQALRQVEDPVEREKWIEALMQELELYNINFDTGNKILDTILATKELQCKKHKINISFLVNGEPLLFMSDADIVSLFSNALDNAIEAVSKISDSEKRLIHLEVSEKHKFLFIRCENYTEEPLYLNNGNPLTSKQDKQSHGFGIKSIKYTVKKYRGNYMLDIKDGWFILDILIPLK